MHVALRSMKVYSVSYNGLQALFCQEAEPHAVASVAAGHMH